MKETLNIFNFLFPFLELILFFSLYGKRYGFMKKFYWSMTLIQSARRLYVNCLVGLLFFINWSCYMTEPNYVVGISAMGSVLFFSNRVSNMVLTRLKTNKMLFLVLMVTNMACYAIPHMNSLFHLLFTIGIAATFYPSESLLNISKIEWLPMDIQIIKNKILKEYNR